MVKNIKLSILISILLSAVFFEKSFSQNEKRDDNISKTIQKNGQRFLKNKNISSVSIGVYKGGQFYTEHFGEIEKGKSNQPNDQTIYEIGSVTKTMAGYLVAKAVLEGKLILEDDVRLHITGDYPNLAYSGIPIRIKDLLTHTSGLPMFLPFKMNGVYEKLNKNVPYEYLALEKDYDKIKFLRDLKNVSITIEPGTDYSYSNAGAELIGYILETVYQKSIDELLKENFSNQYNMLNTAIELDTMQKQKLVRGYWMDSETQAPNNFNPLWATGGGIKMNIKDMMRYVGLQLDSSNLIVSESHKVLSKRGYAPKLSYFWRVSNDKYGTSYNHHGGTSGTQNWLFIFPKHDLGISIITNQSGPKTPKLLSKTAKKILRDITRK